MNKRILAVVGMCLLLCVPANACTIFCFTHNGKTYFCNNEDWIDPITDIAFHPATDGNYAWVYFGFANRWAQGGVNEHGLCFDWVAGGGPFGWKTDPSKKNFEGNLTEEMLRKCKNVDEAIELFKQHNVRHLDYSVALIADKDGNSVLIHWRDGQLKTEKNTDRFHSCGAGKSEVDARLGAFKGDPGMVGLADALRAGGSKGRGGTKYSTVISLSEGKIFLFQNRNFDTYLEIDYLAKLRAPHSQHRIANLFNDANSESGVSRKTIKRTAEYESVKVAIDFYLDGGTTNNFELLSRAFHEDATIQQAGSSEPPSNAIEFFRKRMKPGPKSLRETRIVSLDVSGDVAEAKVEIDYLAFSFIDYFKLQKAENGWKIVSKIYERIEQDNRISLAMAISDAVSNSDDKPIASIYENGKRSGRYYVDEKELNQIGYDLLQSKNIQSAIDVFKVNVDAFPESANAYDSLGESYAAAGNRSLAILNYEKTLELNPDNPNAREILKRLKAER